MPEIDLECMVEDPRWSMADHCTMPPSFAVSDGAGGILGDMAVTSRKTVQPHQDSAIRTRTDQSCIQSERIEVSPMLVQSHIG